MVLSEAEPADVRLCVNCPLKKAVKVAVEGFEGTAGFDDQGTLNYQGGGDCGLTAGRLSPESFANHYPATARDFAACERPRVIEESVIRGWRRIFGISETVEIEQCGAIYESELAKIIEDIIERNNRS